MSRAMTSTVLARPVSGKHILLNGDSLQVSYRPAFDLLLSCPPYFHPTRSSAAHGIPAPFKDLYAYANWVARILQRAFSAVKPGGAICFVKTDVKYKSGLLPLGFHIATACVELGMPICAHWIWERIPYYSPYVPSIGNIFVLGDVDRRLVHCAGVFRTTDCKSRHRPSSFTPALFELLIRQFTQVDDVVLDPFMGTGSTLVAAASSGRWSVGVDLCASQLREARSALVSIRGSRYTNGLLR
jgi:DNA modification methylase